ncbi:MAG: GntR family transcriptional regulator [Pseudomonadota bacterium]
MFVNAYISQCIFVFDAAQRCAYDVSKVIQQTTKTILAGDGGRKLASQGNAALSLEAYERLKQDIRQNILPPGHQDTEPEYAARLGMSRTPVREALIRLEADGLVQLIPRRGARVLPISLDDMEDIYEILTALEPAAAAKLASTRPSAEALAPLRQAYLAMETALDADDLDAWADADDLFHRRMLELHGNKRMLDYVSTLFDQAHRARMITLHMRDKPIKSTQEHKEILEALEAGQSQQVEEIFREHRERARRELLSLLRKFRLSQL